MLGQFLTAKHVGCGCKACRLRKILNEMFSPFASTLKLHEVIKTCVFEKRHTNKTFKVPNSVNSLFTSGELVATKADINQATCSRTLPNGGSSVPTVDSIGLC